jgi:hypothetical protein
VSVGGNLDVNGTIISTNGTGNLIVLGAGMSLGKKGMWFDYSNDNYGIIQAEHQAIAYKAIALNPNGGNVGVGLTNPSQTFQVNGVGYFTSTVYSDNFRAFSGGNNSNLQWDRIAYTMDRNFYILNGNNNGVYLGVNSTSWTGFSDRRIKKNIINLKYGLNDIKLLKPVQFDFIVDTSNNSNRLGFIAQEILPIIPEMVDFDEDSDRYAITMTDLIPVTVKAIQEQQNIIETLQSENLLLKDQIQSILERLTTLENK